MADEPRLGRRGLLYGCALATGATAVQACSGSGDGSGREGHRETGGRGTGGGGADRRGTDGGTAKTAKGSQTDPLPPPEEFHEAPDLARKVKAGTLAPVGKRLPDRPYVIPHRWTRPGTYGGRLVTSVDETKSPLVKEYMYGHSILRYLNDGLDIGPGLAQSWDSNDDATVWTLHFRTGLRWSDGHPWTTADIMFWWQDMVLDSEHPAVPPDDVRSGRDTVAKVSAPDDVTLVLTFDAPAPVTAERLAAYVNRGSGPDWMQPKHYLRQFHPRYNKAVTAPDWSTRFELKANFGTNPDCPTMTGWMLTSYEEGRTSVWQRNPYYWCVDRSGNQLPFIDQLVWNAVKKPEVRKLQYTQGKVDFVTLARDLGLTLADVASLKKAESRTGLRVRFWDSGSGTGSMFYFNYDYPDKGLRELIRDARFRQALSYAFDREEARKTIYYNTGELTTGTLSPKGRDFQVNAEAHRRYREWRDAYIDHDPARAKKILDEIGVVDRDGDGVRERPDGEKLVVRLDFAADAPDEDLHKNNLLKRDWGAVGIKVELNPVSPESFVDVWAQGKLMTTTAREVGDNSPLIYPNWVVPVGTESWAPLHAQAFILQTADPRKLTEQEDRDPWHRHPPWLLPEDGSPVQRLWDLYARARVETDRMRRTKLVWDIVKVHIEHGPFFIGCVANYPEPVLVHEDLENVPTGGELALGGWVNPWIIPCPAVYDPETFFWLHPERHAASS